MFILRTLLSKEDEEIEFIDLYNSYLDSLGFFIFLVGLLYYE